MTTMTQVRQRPFKAAAERAGQDTAGQGRGDSDEWPE